MVFRPSEKVPMVLPQGQWNCYDRNSFIINVEKQIVKTWHLIFKNLLSLSKNILNVFRLD